MKDMAKGSLPTKETPAPAEKRQIKKSEKAAALEEAKGKKGGKKSKKKCTKVVDNDGSSDDNQAGEEDNGGKIEYVTLPLPKLLAKVTPQMKAGRTCHSHGHSLLPSPMTLSSNRGFSQAQVPTCRLQKVGGNQRLIITMLLHRLYLARTQIIGMHSILQPRQRIRLLGGKR
jgi:hypothetical protein